MMECIKQKERFAIAFTVSNVSEAGKNPMLLSAISVSISEANIVFVLLTSGYCFNNKCWKGRWSVFFFIFQIFVARSLFNFQLC